MSPASIDNRFHFHFSMGEQFPAETLDDGLSPLIEHCHFLKYSTYKSRFIPTIKILSP